MANKTVDVKVENIDGKFYAEIKNFTMSMGIKGCPMGRGHTAQSAVTDLIRRVGYESRMNLFVNDVIIMEL